MEYTSTKIDGQQLAFEIETENNGEIIKFNVVCANNESEIKELVEYHLNFINNPKAYSNISPEPQTDLNAIVQEQQELITQLQADVAELKGTL